MIRQWLILSSNDNTSRNFVEGPILDDYTEIEVIEKSIYDNIFDIAVDLKKENTELFKTILSDAELVTELIKEKNILNTKLKTAIQYLKEGKAKFAPNTTNSFVDDFIKDNE